MGQQLDDVYANVRSFGADPTHSDNTDAFRRAIATGRHVLVPAGAYQFSRPIDFPNGGQRCTFLSGAVLQATTTNAFVRVRYGGLTHTLPVGTSPAAGPQVFDNLQLEGPTLSAAHSPLLDVEQASYIVFRNLRITLGRIDDASGEVPAAVRVRKAIGVKFIGGALAGTGTPGTVGLLFTAVGEASSQDGAYESGATGMRIERFGWGFRVDATVDEPCFIDCTFADNVDGAVLITRPSNPTPRVRNPSSTATGMRLISCRMLGGAPQQYLLVDGGVNSRSDNWFGGTILGCTFGAPPPAEGGDGTVKATAGRACILRVSGSVQGIVVAGCRSYPEAGRSSVWIFDDSGSVSRSADTFNSWAQESIASGDAAGDLVIFDAKAAGALTVRNEQQRFDAAKVGFFDTPPRAPGSGYDVSAISPVRVLTSTTAPQVLAQLITELTLLGVLKKR